MQVDVNACFVRDQRCFMQKNDYSLYWEDVGERLIYAELDDYAWKLPEKIFRYKKHDSLYIYHDGKLAAFYSVNDSKKEAEAGYKFYCNNENCLKVIDLKKKVSKKVQKQIALIKKQKPDKISEGQLKNLILKTLSLYHEALSTHYLTQPQFFEKFEQGDEKSYMQQLKRLAQARFRYTRIAWTDAMGLSRALLDEYAKRKGLALKEAENISLDELKKKMPAKEELSRRENGFVLISDNHKIKIVSGDSVNGYINKYERFSDIGSAKGIIGNKGKAKGVAFVVKNENLDLKNPPKGMEKGMILVVQNAWPEFDVYYRLAAAIVTNEGGITSHGVIVAREFGIPCIVGTRIATKVFKDGDYIEVDANKGTVRKLKTKD